MIKNDGVGIIKYAIDLGSPEGWDGKLSNEGWDLKLASDGYCTGTTP